MNCTINSCFIQVSIKEQQLRVAPFEDLKGRKCQVHIQVFTLNCIKSFFTHKKQHTIPRFMPSVFIFGTHFNNGVKIQQMRTHVQAVSGL